MSAASDLYWACPKEVIGATKQTDPGKRLQETARKTAQRAVERLLDLLNDPDASHTDVLKAAALIFERIYPAAAGGDAGDYEICIKEE